MNDERIKKQIGAIFGGMMVFFYIGFGVFFIISPIFDYIDKPLRVIGGSTFFLYGLYRAYRTYIKVREVFFTEEDDESQ